MPKAKSSKKRKLRRPDAPALHHTDCHGRECDLRIMEIKITTWGPSIVQKRQHTSSSSDNCWWWCKPLEDAVQCGHVQCVRFLLEHGARIDAEESPNNPILFHASFKHYNDCAQMNKEIFKILLEAGADVNRICQSNKIIGPIYMQLAMYGDQFLDQIIQCFEYGANPNGTCHLFSGEIQPYLVAVILFSAIETCEVFLKYGADPNGIDFITSHNIFGRNTLNFPPICATFQENLLRHAKLLLMYNANLNINQILGPLERRLENFSLAQYVLLTVSHDQVVPKIFNLLHKFGYDFSKDVRHLPCRHPNHIHIVTRFLGLLKGFCRPLSLKELSRLAIMKCMASRYKTKSMTLFLPQTLYPFLQFEDVQV